MFPVVSVVLSTVRWSLFHDVLGQAGRNHLSFQDAGPTPRKDQPGRRVCQILMARRNRNGEPWSVCLGMLMESFHQISLISFSFHMQEKHRNQSVPIFVHLVRKELW